MGVKYMPMIRNKGGGGGERGMWERGGGWHCFDGFKRNIVIHKSKKNRQLMDEIHL